MNSTGNFPNFFKPILLFLIIGFLLNACGDKQNAAEELMPPKAETIEKELTKHGHTRIDEYYWLNQRDNPKVIEYLKAENRYTEAALKQTEPLQQKLYSEIVSRIKKDDQSVPYKSNGYYYYKRFEERQEYPIHARKKGSLDAEEEIMLDVNQTAKGFSYCQVKGLEVSSNNKLLAFGVDTLSRRIYTIRFKDLSTGEILEDQIPNTTGNVAWANDNKTVFYPSKDSTLRPYKIMKHVLGTDPENDVEVYHEADSTFNTYVYKSKSRKYIFIGSYSTLSTEMRFLDADQPDGDFQVVNPREQEREYSVSHFEDKFYILTNYKAKNFRLMETRVSSPNRENWEEVIPHRDHVLLEDIEVFRDYLVVDERRDGLTQLRIIDRQNNGEHYVDFGEETYMAYISVNEEFDTNLLRFDYSSLTTPHSTYDYHMATKEKTLLKREEVLGGFNRDDYHAERLYAKADDGAKIPISLVYKKGTEKNGDNPLLLYGYGSYGYSMDASFRSDRLSLIDRGFVYAIAHIRGGQEMGRDWYEDGKLLNKKNTFTDFIDCAEHLIAKKYTNPDKLFALGGSAGGLLVGAVANMRPELFKGIVAAVPFVDIVTTMLDESIPLTTSEYDEWGNPNIKKYYDYILSYSPYDNVTGQEYPAMLVTTGLHDSQVQYWEPAKWVAKLRDLKTDDNVLLLHTKMEAGHSGASGRFRRYKETALIYAFMLDQMGIHR